MNELEKSKNCCFNALNEELGYSSPFSLLYSIAEAYFSKKQYDDAENLLLQLLTYKHNNSDIATFYLLGYIFENALTEKYNANRDQAQIYYEKAIKLTPNNAIDWSYRGIIFQHLKNYNDSIKAYTKAIELNPNYAYVWNNKGSALNSQGYYLEGQGKHDEAIKAYEEAIKVLDKIIKPEPNFAALWNDKGYNLNFAVPWNNKGYALNGLRNYDEAIKAYDEAIGLDHNYADAWFNKGETLYNQCKYDDAIKAYNEAIRLDPNNIFARHKKREALDALGRTTESNVAFTKWS